MACTASGLLTGFKAVSLDKRSKWQMSIAAFMLIVCGAGAIATKHLSQGKWLSHAEPLRGNTARLFGVLLILIGAFMLKSAHRRDGK
jgi:hypothetical protein